MRFSQSTHLLMRLSLMHITRTGLPVLMELIDLVNCVISNDLTQMANFPTRILDCDSHSPALLSLFISSDTLVFVLQWLSFDWEISIMLLSQFPLIFHHIYNGMPCFITLRMTILVTILFFTRSRFLEGVSLFQGELQFLYKKTKIQNM